MFRQSLIFSRSANDGILSAQDIATRAPAVFSTTKAEHLTDRYKALQTSDLIPVLADYNYFPVQAAQKKQRKGGLLGEHNHHLVAFANANDIGVEGAAMRPEIIVYNSHDGTGAVRIFAGAYRFICSNGIISGAGYDTRVYHSVRALNGFEDMLKVTVEALPTMMAAIERMQQTRITLDAAHDMARQAVSARWELFDQSFVEQKRKGTYATDATVRDVLKITRSEDDSTDAWTVFNRIQESVVRGNAFVKSITEKAPEGAMRKARPIASIAEHVRINRELWDIAESVAV